MGSQPQACLTLWSCTSHFITTHGSLKALVMHTVELQLQVSSEHFLWPMCFLHTVELQL
jgi:hypothetical protein